MQQRRPGYTSSPEKMNMSTSRREEERCREERGRENWAEKAHTVPSATLVMAGGYNDFQEKVFRCNINVTDLCNQRCSYCINADTHNKNRRVLDPAILEQFIEDVAERVTDRSYFSVAGGEPFMYPHLHLLVKKLADTIPGSSTQLRFLTNGSMLPRAALPLYDIKGKLDLQYVVSVHMEFMDVEKFLSNIRDFPYKDDILCKILMAPGQLEAARRHLAILEEAGLQTYVNAATGVPMPFTEEEMEFLHRYPNTFKPIDLVYVYSDGSTLSKSDPDMVFSKEYFDFRGMWCAAGITSLRLAPDGKVIPCFGVHAIPRDRRPVYDITKTRLRDIPELNMAWKCPSSYCFCSPFLSAPKWRPGTLQPQWLD